ncbi:unnamed protein product [Prorocentrum cordatum]|uniref:MFS transporter n=1 Tax=Prorocentrum cordatum TaxID=2364126 RepID=A0ABN9Q064_9DINO|nr:unnamed protein product [Polarella glacialis]
MPRPWDGGRFCCAQSGNTSCPQDILLPFFGLGISALGVQLTLFVSLVEPLLLLALPSVLRALRGFDHRLLSWHLGSLIGHPMIVAQVAISRAERGRPACGAAAFGALVGAYALGALAGTAMALHPLFPPEAGAARARVAPNEAVRLGAIALLVASSLLALPFVGRLLAEVKRTFGVAHECAPELAARSLVVFGLSLIMGAMPRLASVSSEDVLSGFLAWGDGRSVLWFDIVGVVTSGVVVPILLSPGLGALAGGDCLDCTLRLGCLSCALLALASAKVHLEGIDAAFDLAVAAGGTLSFAAALAHTVLSTRMLEEIAEDDAGIALGWGVFAGGSAELAGSRLGEALSLHWNFLWPSALALLACTAAQWALRQRPARPGGLAVPAACA